MRCAFVRCRGDGCRHRYCRHMRKFNRYRYAFRWAVRVRTEGASLSVTIPKYVTRLVGIAPGDQLLLKMTEDGILLRPRHFKTSPSVTTGAWQGRRSAARGRNVAAQRRSLA
jgi:AbrB family looped-hinge helix DNA binding protein